MTNLDYPAECGEVRCEQCDFYNKEEDLHECGNVVNWMLAEHEGENMLNIERYRDELEKIGLNFNALAVKNGKPYKCWEIECRECDFDPASCRKENIGWLCRECRELRISWDKDIDWEHVPAGTPVMVSDVQDAIFIKCSFAVYVPKAKRKYLTFVQRGEHGDAEGVESWNYCELVNPEDIERYRRKIEI